MSHNFKADLNFVIALDIVARTGQSPILVVVDKGAADYSICQLGDDTTGEIITALEAVIETSQQLPVAIETDNALCFSALGLQEWLGAKGIEHRYRPLPPIVEALIRQHSMDWADL